MLAHLKSFFCCTNSFPSDYQVATVSTSRSVQSSDSLVLPLSQMKEHTKNQLESKKEILYYSSASPDISSIYLNDIIKAQSPELVITKAVFGLNHILLLLQDASRTYLAGFGSNENGQLGLPVYSKNRSSIDVINSPSLNCYNTVILIDIFDSADSIVDIAAANNFSLVLVENAVSHKKTLYRFELSQEELFNIDNITGTRIHSIKVEPCPEAIVQGISRIYAKNERIILQVDTDNSVYIKGMTFHLDINLKYKLFKSFKNKISNISIGINHCLIHFANNTLISFGHNEYGELGVLCNNPKEINELTFFKGHIIKKVCSGYRHSLVLCEDGVLYAFGDNNSKQCLGDADYYQEPKVINVLNVVDIECGGKFSLVKNAYGEVHVWGECSFLFKDDVCVSQRGSCGMDGGVKLINDIKLKSIAGFFAGNEEVLFFAEKFN